MNINHDYDFISNINISERHFYSELKTRPFHEKYDITLPEIFDMMS